jgi:hypothetical protein
VDRRNRWTRLTSEPITPMGSMTMAPVATASTGRSASEPSGFTTFGNWLSSNRPGPNRIARKVITMLMPKTQANHRQRGDGRCPSGKSRSRNVAGRPTIGSHIGWSNASAIAPRCSPPTPPLIA